MTEHYDEELFDLEIIADNPKFEGFAINPAPSVLGRDSIDEDITPGFEASETVRIWSPVRLAKLWKSPRVSGRVAPYQDFPGIDMVLPAFSKRACDALRDFLEPNGELLPLDSDAGDYYFYNITTVIDALDVARSKCRFWCDPPTTATEVDYFAFHKEKLVGQSIFRIVELPMYTIVTTRFVERVYEFGLNGFEFHKIWPFPEGVDWREESRRKPDDKNVQKLRHNTVVILLALSGSKPNAKENRQFKRFEDELDAILKVPSLNAPFFGRYEGHDIVENELRMFISCPNADVLVRKLLPWLYGLNWTGAVGLMKRYGKMHDADALEELVELT